MLNLDFVFNFLVEEFDEYYAEVVCQEIQEDLEDYESEIAEFSNEGNDSELNNLYNEIILKRLAEKGVAKEFLEWQYTEF